MALGGNRPIEFNITLKSSANKSIGCMSKSFVVKKSCICKNGGNPWPNIIYRAYK
jgi:hypothetical protein